MDWQPLVLSLQLAGLTTLILLPLAGALVYLHQQLPGWAKPVFKAVVSLPLVLPPTVLGYYLLLLFRPDGAVGRWTEQWLGLSLVFSFAGLVVASVVFSLPFMANPLVAAVERLPVSLTEAAQTLGKGQLAIFWSVVLPNVKPALVTGAALAFAHSIGEFGLVLMIGGSIPGQTRTASIAIYQEMEQLHYATADQYALVLFFVSMLLLSLIYALRGRVSP
jgi:molybdate transport system permease protein